MTNARAFEALQRDCPGLEDRLRSLRGLPKSMSDSARPGSDVSDIAMERAALDRWGLRRPVRLRDLGIDVVYFTRSWKIGWTADALAAHYEPFGARSISRYEMDNAKVQFAGDAAVLTFNLVSYGGTEDAPMVHECPAIETNASRPTGRSLG
jgi:hypothetical protein